MIKLTEQEFNNIWHICSGNTYPDALNFMKGNGYIEKSKLEEFQEYYKSLILSGIQLSWDEFKTFHAKAMAAIKEAKENKE